MEQSAAQKTFEERRYEQLRLERSLGRTALEGYEQRRFDELTSGIAEALSGAVNTEYSFGLQEGRLVAEDGEPIEELMVRGLRQDMKLAASDPFYNFLPGRSRAELDNFRRIQAGVTRQSGENTWLEISPHNEELDTSQANRQKLVKAAQKPYWGRTMVRLSHWDGQRLHIITMSSDNLNAAKDYDYSGNGSSVRIMQKAVKRRLGYEYDAGDSNGTLAEPIGFDIKDQSWKELASGVVDEADNILSEIHGGAWRQGRPAGETMNLQKYVESQTQVIQGLLKNERRIAGLSDNFYEYNSAFGQEMYKCIALLEARLKSGNTSTLIADYDTAAGTAGAMAQAEGRVYDMCGQIIGANTPNAAQQTGSESLMRLMGQPVECPFCDKNVIVAAADLKDGKLYCRDCDMGVDVCTGKKFSRGKKGAEKKRSFVDELIEDFQLWNVKYDQERAAKKQTAPKKAA